MELKERYYRKLDTVLSVLLTEVDVNIADRRIKEISGEDWESIKEYIKTRKVASFASGMIWHINQEKLRQSTSEVKIELDSFKQSRISNRKDALKQIIINIISSLIVGAVSFWVGILWERNHPSPINPNQKTEHSYNNEKKDSIDSQLLLKTR
ncbi:MAG: hypothetical protein HDS16_05185 [Bacteroides sp.]|nr:hypothetical protein [Bacteroides sp.]